MFKGMYNALRHKVYTWLIEEPATVEIMPYDFNRLKYEIRPGDVLLIEGRSRISRIIRSMTQSPWTHAALYIGRLVDFEDEELKAQLRLHTSAKDTTRLIIEGILDQGTIVSPLNIYRHHHIRVCRPIGITPSDKDKVISYAISALGKGYNVRHLLDMARYLLPWTILPRRWRSSLFRTASGEPDGGICSSLLAEAFASVQFPILPFLKPSEIGMEVFARNQNLYTPKDFDYSPYFEIIKFPFFNPDEPLPYYRRLPWTKTGLLHQDYGILTAMNAQPPKKKKKSLFSKEKVKKESEETNTKKVLTPSTTTDDHEDKT